MITVHELKIARRCPVDDTQDLYEVSVETVRLLKVEDILAAIQALPEKAFQEEITTLLAARLGCCVVTTGYHSGVKTICRA
jgi:hypothetical protein